MENCTKDQLEDLIKLLFTEIGEHQASIDDKRKNNVFRMKQRYDIFQQEYKERFGSFYEIPL